MDQKFRGKKTKNIFIIDDDKYLTEAMEKLLESDTYHVESFNSAKKGVAKAVDTPPDIILLDYSLRDEDTHDVVEELHRKDITKHIPLVLISASDTAAIAAQKWHMTAFLQKPFQVNALLQLVDKYTM